MNIEEQKENLAQNFLKKKYGLKENDKITQAMHFQNKMTNFKSSLLPAKRDLYGSIYRGNMNPFGQHKENEEIFIT
jgi:hypothetical protein